MGRGKSGAERSRVRQSEFCSFPFVRYIKKQTNKNLPVSPFPQLQIWARGCTCLIESLQGLSMLVKLGIMPGKP